MTTDRLARQIAFIVELDKLKSVLRRTTLMDGSRRENSAEHSWHLALMAVLLAEHADTAFDVARVVKMVLIHDVVEIDAGDTFCYDEVGLRDQTDREQRAAQRLFSLLPPDQADDLGDLWHEFEARQTVEARYAVALDRLQPMLCNMESGGGSWAHYGISVDQVIARMAPVAGASHVLAEYTRQLIGEAVDRGYLAASDRPADAPHTAG